MPSKVAGIYDKLLFAPWVEFVDQALVKKIVIQASTKCATK
jgi:hypothetical protein